jgi:hypothetical protein
MGTIRHTAIDADVRHGGGIVPVINVTVGDKVSDLLDVVGAHPENHSIGGLGRSPTTPCFTRLRAPYSGGLSCRQPWAGPGTSVCAASWRP